MIVVYYDGKCGLCSREINYYKKISDSKKVDWIDVARNPNALKSFGISQAEALLYLHAKDDNNVIYTRVDAFILMWSAIPKWRIVAKIAKLTIFKQCLEFAYVFFAKRRFSRYEHCKLADTS